MDLIRDEFIGKEIPSDGDDSDIRLVGAEEFAYVSSDIEDATCHLTYCLSHSTSSVSIFSTCDVFAGTPTQ